LYHLARLHSLRGDTDKAVRALEELVELSESDKTKGLEMVKKLALALDECGHGEKAVTLYKTKVRGKRSYVYICIWCLVDLTLQNY
jgi:hypothetical protein